MFLACEYFRHYTRSGGASASKARPRSVSTLWLSGGRSKMKDWSLVWGKGQRVALNEVVRRFWYFPKPHTLPVSLEQGRWYINIWWLTVDQLLTCLSTLLRDECTQGYCFDKMPVLPLVQQHIHERQRNDQGCKRLCIKYSHHSFSPWTTASPLGSC